MQMDLPIDWEKIVQGRTTPVGTFLQNDRKKFPLFLVRLPNRVNLDDITVEFGPIDCHHYTPEGSLISLKIIFKDIFEYELEVDCLFNPQNQAQKSFFHRLSATHFVDMVVIADEPDFPIIGNKTLYWSGMERKRVKSIFLNKHIFSIRTINWPDLKRRYLSEHPPYKGSLSSINDSKSLIDIYKLQRNFQTEKLCGRLFSTRQPALIDFLETINNSAISATSIAKKYRLAPSGLVMINYFTEQNTQMRLFPQYPIWVEGEQSFSANGPMSSIKAIFWYPFIPLGKPSSERYHSFRQTWVLEMINMAGTVDATYYYSPNQEWVTPLESYTCPTNACTKKIHANGGRSLLECDQCRCLKEQKTNWFMIMLLVVLGFFAERETIVVHEDTNYKDTAKSATKKQSAKPTEHSYTMVRFDASLKKVYPHKEHKHQKASWLEETLAVDPDAVLYVDRSIAQTQRLLRHERFTHKRGQFITVKSHERRVPMKISEIRRKLTHVFASKFEAEEGEGK